MRCSICGEKISGSILTWWRQPHYRSSHPEYSRWVKHWMRGFYALVIPLILATALIGYAWFSMGGIFEVFAGVVVVLFFGFCLYEIDFVLRRNIRRYARQWRDQNPNLATKRSTQV